MEDVEGDFVGFVGVAAGLTVLLVYPLVAPVAELEAARAGSTLVLSCELADDAALPGLVTDTVARFGRLDALVNNASAFYPTPVGSATTAQWDELFASNARGPFFLAQAAAPHHVKRDPAPSRMA